MKTSIIWISLVMSFMFVGCNNCYYAIDSTPKEKNDSFLLGTWKSKESNRAGVTITAASSNTYNIYQFDLRRRVNKIQRDFGLDTALGFISYINGVEFLNIASPEKVDSNVYGFYKIISKDKEKGVLYAASFKIDTPMSQLQSANQVRAYISARLNSPECYSDTMKFKRCTVHSFLGFRYLK